MIVMMMSDDSDDDDYGDDDARYEQNETTTTKGWGVCTLATGQKQHKSRLAKRYSSQSLACRLRAAMVD